MANSEILAALASFRDQFESHLTTTNSTLKEFMALVNNRFADLHAAPPPLPPPPSEFSTLAGSSKHPFPPVRFTPQQPTPFTPNPQTHFTPNPPAAAPPPFGSSSAPQQSRLPTAPFQSPSSASPGVPFLSFDVTSVAASTSIAAATTSAAASTSFSAAPPPVLSSTNGAGKYDLSVKTPGDSVTRDTGVDSLRIASTVDGLLLPVELFGKAPSPMPGPAPEVTPPPPPLSPPIEARLISAIPSPPAAPSASPSPTPVLPVKRLPFAEIKNKHERELRYNCDENSSPSHMGKDGREKEPTEDSSSLHSLARGGQSKSLKLTGRVGPLNFQVWVDSGSTHSFILLDVAEKLKLSRKELQPFQVFVENGNYLICKLLCPRVRLMMQGNVFHGVSRRLVIFCLYTLEEVYKDILESPP